MLYVPYKLPFVPEISLIKNKQMKVDGIIFNKKIQAEKVSCG